MNDNRLSPQSPEPALCDLDALAELPAAQLLGRLEQLVARMGALTAQLLAHLGEVDARKLYAQAACSSMFGYCVQVLGLSEPASYKRLCAARAARRFPLILQLVHQGQLHLSGVCLLAPRLDEGNARELLLAACGKSKRQIEQLLAERFPAPDVPPSVRALPRRAGHAQTSGEPSAPSRELPLATPPAAAPTLAAAEAGEASRPEPAAPSAAAAPASCAPAPSGPPPAGSAPSATGAGRGGRQASGQVTPLAPRRYKVQLTASASLHAKLCEAQQLLGHQVAPGDLAAVMERALDALLPQLRRQRFAETSRPRRRRTRRPEARAAEAGRAETPSASATGARPEVARPEGGRRSRSIPAQIKREVARRDGYRCTFVDPATGRRCEERSQLEYHHEQPWAMGGNSDADNLRLLCRTHNRYLAEQDYGAELIRRFQSESRTTPGGSAPRAATPADPSGGRPLSTGG